MTYHYEVVLINPEKPWLRLKGTKPLYGHDERYMAVDFAERHYAIHKQDLGLWLARLKTPRMAHKAFMMSAEKPEVVSGTKPFIIFWTARDTNEERGYTTKEVQAKFKDFATKQEAEIFYDKLRVCNDWGNTYRNRTVSNICKNF